MWSVRDYQGDDNSCNIKATKQRVNLDSSCNIEQRRNTESILHTHMRKCEQVDWTTTHNTQVHTNASETTSKLGRTARAAQRKTKLRAAPPMANCALFQSLTLKACALCVKTDWITTHHNTQVHTQQTMQAHTLRLSTIFPFSALRFQTFTSKACALSVKIDWTTTQHERAYTQHTMQAHTFGASIVFP